MFHYLLDNNDTLRLYVRSGTLSTGYITNLNKYHLGLLNWTEYNTLERNYVESTNATRKEERYKKYLELKREFEDDEANHVN